MTTLGMFRNTTDGESFAAGQIIFREGEPGDVMYVVQEGEVDVLVGDRVLTRVGPGGIVGELALIDSSARSGTVQAVTDCKLVPINQKRFTYLVQQTPYFAIEVMRVMAERLRTRTVENAR